MTLSRPPAGGHCTIAECARPHYASGYCSPHWRRWRRNGNPGPVEIKSQPQPCTFQGCERPRSAKKLCASHYAQHRKGKTLTVLNDRVNPQGRDAQGNKRCATCKQWLPEGSFKIVRRNPDGLSGACCTCSRDRIIRRRYGITGAQYDALLAAQGGVCAICKGMNDSGRAMAVDHNRSCCPGERSCSACIRGILCSRCNCGVGLFLDQIHIMEAAIGYLKGILKE